MRTALLSLSAVILLSSGACDRVQPVGSGDAGDKVTDDRDSALDPGTRPVRIGEGGAGFDACPSNGTVVDLTAGATLAVRAAPFANAALRGQLANGARVQVCTRSIDQRWLGVVVLPAGAAGPDGNTTLPTPDCGIPARIEDARDYDGPCVSGWVTSALIRFSAN